MARIGPPSWWRCRWPPGSAGCSPGCECGDPGRSRFTVERRRAGGAADRAHVRLPAGVGNRTPLPSTPAAGAVRRHPDLRNCQCDRATSAPRRSPRGSRYRPAGAGFLHAQHRAAWRHSTGNGVAVAVIDTGVTPNRRLSVVGGGDYIMGGDGLTDCDAHGTIVASLINAAPQRLTDAGSHAAKPCVPAACRRTTRTRRGAPRPRHRHRRLRHRQNRGPSLRTALRASRRMRRLSRSGSPRGPTNR